MSAVHSFFPKAASAPGNKPNTRKGFAVMEDGNLPAHLPKKTGRPPLYSDDLADEFLAAIRSGRSENEVCKQPGMPSAETVRKWSATNINGFFGKYAEAREVFAHVIAGDCIQIADEENAGADAAEKAAFEQQRKARIDARKWFASKVLPRIYGDRVAVDHTVSVNPEQMTDSQLAAIAAKSGLVIDHQPIEDENEA